MPLREPGAALPSVLRQEATRLLVAGALKVTCARGGNVRTCRRADFTLRAALYLLCLTYAVTPLCFVLCNRGWLHACMS